MPRVGSVHVYCNNDIWKKRNWQFFTFEVQRRIFSWCTRFNWIIVHVFFILDVSYSICMKTSVYYHFFKSKNKAFVSLILFFRKRIIQKLINWLCCAVVNTCFKVIAWSFVDTADELWMGVVNMYMYYWLPCSFLMFNTFSSLLYRIMSLYLTLCQFHNSVEVEVRYYMYFCDWHTVMINHLTTLMFSNHMIRGELFLKAGY